MEWRDEAIVLSLRPHGESAAIVTLLTLSTAAMLDWPAARAAGAAVSLYQTGNRVQAVWRARLGEQLGNSPASLSKRMAAG
jgi:DNA repair protein RecO (recombination protein O)